MTYIFYSKSIFLHDDEMNMNITHILMCVFVCGGKRSSIIELYNSLKNYYVAGMILTFFFIITHLSLSVLYVLKFISFHHQH